MSAEKVFLVLKVAVVPYIVGLLLSSLIVPEPFYGDGKRAAFASRAAASTASVERDLSLEEEEAAVAFDAGRSEAFDTFMGLGKRGDPFASLHLVLHRNGEVDSCARTSSEGTYDAIKKTAMVSFRQDPADYSKHVIDALLTRSLAFGLLKNDECGPYDGDKGKRPGWGGRVDSGRKDALASFIAFCDMGKDRTPVLPGHGDIVPVDLGGSSGHESLPCHFHTREGVRVTSLDELADLARKVEATCGGGAAALGDEGGGGAEDNGTCAAGEESRGLHLYAVPAGRLFMFAPAYVGEVFKLPHVRVSSGKPVSLEVISLSPRVFDVKNFYSREESAEIVKKALSETSESHRIKRSSTGASGYNINARRTSENGFDTHGRVAMEVKRRCFDVLGFDEYVESMADGLQVLRYNMTTAYIPHLDWIDDPGRRQEHNFDSAGTGSNRFGTILLYMSDLFEGDGGETIFAEGWPIGQPENERIELKAALRELRASGDAKDLAKGSWEEEMVAKCRTRLAIRPHSSRAVLFYSQHPNGEADNASLHGGCPVLNGTKWAANLWVWNAPRNGYPGAPRNEDVIKKNRSKGAKQEEQPGQLSAVFKNRGVDSRFKNAKLYFQETFWGDLGFGDPPLAVNTFEGHEWNVMVDGKRLQQFVIDKRPQQHYSV